MEILAHMQTYLRGELNLFGVTYYNTRKKSFADYYDVKSINQSINQSINED